MNTSVLLGVVLFAASAAGAHSGNDNKAPLFDDVVTRRVFGGSVVPQGSTPWLANRNRQCGGSLIAPTWLLTAGHCTSMAVGSTVTLNRWNLGVPYEWGGEEIMITQRIVFPGYELRGDYSARDLSLVKLAAPSNVKPARILRPDEEAELEKVGKMLTVTGWGALTENDAVTFTPLLQAANVPVIANSVCGDLQHYGAMPRPVEFDMLCAGYDAGGPDSCTGDSGGPLYTRVGNEDVLVGVVSWGKGCGRPFRPGVYARISKFRAWIEQITGLKTSGTTYTPPLPNVPFTSFCENNCGKAIKPAAGGPLCYCDELCPGNGDCCVDYTAFCVAKPTNAVSVAGNSGTTTNSVPTTSTPSCKSKCGGFSQVTANFQLLSCWCDGQCKNNGDCCGDVDFQCNGLTVLVNVYPTPAPTQKYVPPTTPAPTHALSQYFSSYTPPQTVAQNVYAQNQGNIFQFPITQQFQAPQQSSFNFFQTTAFSGGPLQQQQPFFFYGR